MPSCRQAVLLSNVTFYPATGEQDPAPDAAGEGKLLGVPVEVVRAHTQTAGCILDREQLIWLTGCGGRRAQAGNGRVPDLFDLAQKTGKFLGGKFPCDPEQGLEFLTQFRELLSDSCRTVALGAFIDAGSIRNVGLHIKPATAAFLAIDGIVGNMSAAKWRRIDNLRGVSPIPPLYLLVPECHLVVQTPILSHRIDRLAASVLSESSVKGALYGFSNDEIWTPRRLVLSF
jgi:hypothetical protein